MSKRKRPAVRRLGTSNKNTEKLDATTLLVQRQRLLERLRKSSVTTVEARHQLNIMAPAPRVHELRHKYGHVIRTDWVSGFTPEGFKHRFGCYSLVREKIHAGSKQDE